MLSKYERTRTQTYLTCEGTGKKPNVRRAEHSNVTTLLSADASRLSWRVQASGCSVVSSFDSEKTSSGQNRSSSPATYSFFVLLVTIRLVVLYDKRTQLVHYLNFTSRDVVLPEIAGLFSFYLPATNYAGFRTFEISKKVHAYTIDILYGTSERHFEQLQF